MKAVVRWMMLAALATHGVLTSAATGPVAPGVPTTPLQPGAQTSSSASDKAKFWNIMQAVAVIVEQVIAAVISAGGWGNAGDAQEIIAAVAAEITAITTTIEQLPDIVILRAFPAQIAGFQEQNRAAGKPQANLLTAPQIDSLMRSVSMASATNPRLANDLKALLGRLPRS